MNKGSSRAYWWQFLFVGIGMIAYTICRTGFPVGLAAMGHEFKWTPFEVGVLSTIFLLGQALIDIPAGFWVDRLDRKKVLIFGLFGIGLLTTLVTLAGGFWSALVLRIIFGIAEGVFNIAQFAVAGSIHPEHRALVNGMTQVFYGIGNYGGQGFVGGLLKTHPGFWQLPLYWLGGVTMVYAVLSIFLFRPQYLRRFETPNELTRHGFWKTVRIVFTNVKVWKALAIHGSNMIPNWAIQGLGNYLFISYRHYPSDFTAKVFGIGFGVGGLLVPLATVWADRLGRRPVICFLALWTAFFYFLLFFVAQPDWTMIVIGVLAAWGTTSLYTLGYTITQDAVATVSMSGIGVATGIAGGAGYLIAVSSGPLVSSLIPRIGPIWAIFVIVLGCELLCAAFAFWFLRGEKLPNFKAATSAGSIDETPPPIDPHAAA